MNIVGISAFYHESACCIFRNGRLVAAASEERFSRVKHDPRLPVEAFRFCLQKAGIGIGELDAIAFYEKPTLKLARQLCMGVPAEAMGDLSWLDAGQAERAIRERLGFEGAIYLCEHHQAHAASAYFFSGFPHAALFTVDGVGEWATTSYGRAGGAQLELFEEVRFPHSLGLLYATITSYLGFRVNDGEYKVMGLAPYGKSRFLSQMRKLVRNEPGGGYRLALEYFDFTHGNRMYSQALCDLFGAPPREKEAKLESFHMDVAKSLQQTLEDILLEKVRYLAKQVDSPNLCMAGGVALNCVANGRILREGPFERLFVQPAAGDAGGCLGAAALAHIELTGDRPSDKPMRQVFLGPAYRASDVADLLEATGIQPLDFRDRESALLEAAADRLARNQVVGWFQGAMEFGPRALGARSILANPMDPHIRGRLNQMIKKRESFRPFAPSVLAHAARDHFDLDHASPFMLETCRVISNLELPGITHVNGSARPQTVDPKHVPRYAALLECFYQKTGCPILVNTSFNVRDEPIVLSPVDALFCMGEAGLDCLVIEDFLIDRSMLPSNWPNLFNVWRRKPKTAFNPGKSAISENLYTFV